MPMIRYQIRNEYGLADPDLYRSSGRDDPEALLEGVAMAGLVGVLRQLGDLAEFAAEIFHELHEEVMATTARGHGLMVRVQQLETEFPSIEKAFLSQINHSHFSCNAGIDWHANIHIDQNLITRGDMPRFILDSYEECRGPPRLFMLDKFDVAGAGTCLQRYSDPSFFKTELASSGTMETEVQREKKGHKIKKKVSYWKNGDVESSLAPQPEISGQVPEKNPAKRAKLKPRVLNVVDTSRRSYMESLLEVHSPEQEVLFENSVKIKSIGSAPEAHEIVVDNSEKYPSFTERNPTQPPIKQISEVPTIDLENQKINGEEILETSAEFENNIEHHDAENNAPPLLVCQNKLLADVESFITEGFADGSRSDDIGSEVDNFMDALNNMESEIETDSEWRAKSDPLNNMESEIETDSEWRAKSDPGLFSVESQAVLSDDNKRQKETLAHFSGQDSVDISYEGMPSVSISNNLGNLVETHDTSSEEIWGNGEATKLESSVHLLSDGTRNDEAPVIPNFRSEIGEAFSNSCVTDSTYTFMHLCPQGSFDEAQLVTSDSNEISSCYVKSEDKGAEHLDGSPQGSSYSSGRTYPSEHVEEPTSEDIYQKKDESIHEQAPIGHVEDLLSPESESRKEDTEAYSGPIISRTASALDPELMQSDTVVAEMERVMLPEDIAAEISTGGRDVLENAHPSEDESIHEQDPIGHVEYFLSPESDSGPIVSRTTSTLYPEIIQSDGLVAEMESVMQPEDLVAETSTGFVRGAYDVAECLDDGSPLGNSYFSGETHPSEHVEELISEDIAGIVDISNHIYQKKDKSIHEQDSIVHVEDLLSPESESRKEDTEACSGPIMPPLYPEIMQSDGLFAERERVIQPEDLAAEISTGGRDVLENAHPSEDDEELGSPQIQSRTFLVEPPAGYVEDSPPPLTVHIQREPQEFIERDTEVCSDGVTSPTSSSISSMTSHITVQPADLAAEAESYVEPADELAYSQTAGGHANTDDMIVLPNIMPLDSVCLLEGEFQESRNVESAEFAPCLLHEYNSEVIDRPVAVGDDSRSPFKSTVPDLHNVALQIEQPIQFDDSSTRIVTAEAILDCDEPSDNAFLSQHIFDNNEPSSPNNAAEIPLSPLDENLPMSVSAVSSTELFDLDLSDPALARLFNGICHTMSSDHAETDLPLNIDGENPLYSLETDQDFFIQPQILVEESPKAQAGDETDVMSSYQEDERSEPSDLRFEIAQFGEQDIIQSDSVEPSGLGPEEDSHVTDNDEDINELDIRPSNTGIRRQLEPEASVPSECSDISAAGLPLFASFDRAISASTLQQFSEPQISGTVSSFQLQDLHETPPALPPLPPLEWRTGKVRLGCPTSDGNLFQPSTGTNPFTGLSGEPEIVQEENLLAPLPATKDDGCQHDLLSLHSERVRPLRLSELPPIVEDQRHQHAIQGEVVHPPDEVSQHLHQLQAEKIQPLEDRGPQLVQLLPALEAERSLHGTLSIERDMMQSMTPFFIESSVEDEKYQYNYGVYGGENMQEHLNWSSLPTSGPMMQHHGFISPWKENPFTPYDGRAPSIEYEKPNGKLCSIRNRPRHPLIDAVAAHDKSKLRKVSELIQPLNRPKADERDTLLEQIRNKSFNLKPTASMKPNIKGGPQTNLKVAAILEKANAIRQACVGSDEDDDNGDSWSDC